MSTDQLPGLQMAIALLAQIGDDDSDRAIAAVHDLAQRVADLEAIVSAPRGTDAQITKERAISAASIDGALAFGYEGCSAPEAGHWLLGAHNAGARIAELERHAANLVSESEAKIPAMQAAADERLTLDRANRLLVARIAGLETKCVTLKELHDAAADERDEARRMFYAACQASAAFAIALGMDETENDPSNIGDAIDELIAERDELRKELECAEEAADVAACSLRSEDSDGYECIGSYIRAVTQQLVKERDALRSRLAEIEAQEPVATAWITGGRMVNAFNHPPRSDFDPDGRWAEIGYSQQPLYARPVPAIPEGWKLVNAGALAMVVNALRRDAEEGRPVRGEMADELIAAAPEHKA